MSAVAAAAIFGPVETAANIVLGINSGEVKKKRNVGHVDTVELEVVHREAAKAVFKIWMAKIDFQRFMKIAYVRF